MNQSTPADGSSVSSTSSTKSHPPRSSPNGPCPGNRRILAAGSVADDWSCFNRAIGNKAVILVPHTFRSMSHRIAHRLNVARRAVLMTAVIAALAAAVPQTTAQQTPAAEGKLTFEAATIKPAAPDAVRNVMIPTANRMRIPSMTLSWLIYTAYGNGGFNTGMRVSGGPDWVKTT